MTNDMTAIGKPFLKDEGSLVKLCAQIELDGMPRTMWYGVPQEFSSYLTCELADCFLVALIPSIAKRGGAVRVEGLVSSHLKFKLENVLGPLLPIVSPLWSSLRIDAPVSHGLSECGHAVGTGCSCGIDSMFTISRYTSPDVPDDWKLTHLLYLKAGAQRHTHLGAYGAEKETVLAEGRLKNAHNFAARIGLPLLYMQTNLGDFLDGYEHECIHTYLSCSCVLALQKLFRTYFFSSGFHSQEHRFDPNDSALYDLELVECFSTENTTFYSDGYEKDRYVKTRVVSEYEPAHDYLNVCIYEVENCTRCTKCLRTISQLEMLGTLDSFSRVFDLEFYRAHRIQFLGEGLYGSGYYYNEMMRYLPESCLTETERKKIRIDYRWRRFLNHSPLKGCVQMVKHFFKNRV